MSSDVLIVDVAAAALGLLSDQAQGILPARFAVPGDPLPEIPPQPGQVPLDEARCQFSHPNPAGGKFCPECGLPVSSEARVVSITVEPPKPYDELTAEEKAARDQQHQQSLAANAAFAAQEPEEIVPVAGDNVVIHFVDDGFTAFGKVWLRGNQLSIGPSHPRWPDAVRWITLTPPEQFERYGKQYFAPGPVQRQESAREQWLQVEARRHMRPPQVSMLPDEDLIFGGE